MTYSFSSVLKAKKEVFKVDKISYFQFAVFFKSFPLGFKMNH